MRAARPPASIAQRLIATLTVGFALAWCGAAAYASFISYRELNKAFDRSLQEAADRLLPLVVADLKDFTGGKPMLMRGPLHGIGDYLSYQLLDSAGRVLARTGDAPSLPSGKIPAPGFQTVGDHRLYSEADASSGFTMVVTETTNDRRLAIDRGATGMAFSLIGLIPLCIAIIWFAVRGARRPVLRLSSEVAARGEHNLAPLDTSDQPSELKPIAVAVAHLVERLRAALDAERAFAANSAHELRTPIAGALAQTQLMVAELRDPRDRRRARDVERTLKHLSTLVEKLMQLSRVDAGMGFSDRANDLIPILNIVIDDYRKRLDSPERIQYAKPEQARLVAQMDVDAFAIAVRNLIDNAVNHGEAGGVVHVVVEPEGIIRIINSGAVIAPATIASLKARFVRGSTPHSGSGLGLAIVDMILGQTHGKLELFSPSVGGSDGFEARMTIELASDASARSSVRETV